MERLLGRGQKGRLTNPIAFNRTRKVLNGLVICPHSAGIDNGTDMAYKFTAATKDLGKRFHARGAPSKSISGQT